MFGTGMRIAGPWFGGIEREVRRLHRELDMAFPAQANPGAAPAINIWRNEGAVVLTCELAGVNPDELEIEIKGKALTLSVQRQEPEAAPTYKEIWSGRATRTIELPFEVQADKVTAHFSKGVLYLSLPEAEAARPIRISVN